MTSRQIAEACLAANEKMAERYNLKHKEEFVIAALLSDLTAALDNTPEEYRQRIIESLKK